MAVSTNRRGGVDVQGAFGEFWKKNSANILPPILGVIGFLLVWQFLSSTGLIKLPGPISVWTDERTRILLLYPFMNSKTYGIGLFWQTLASLERVAKGYTLAAAVGITGGVLVGTNPLLNKALDPIFQFLRMVAPLAWVPIALAALQQNEPAALFVIFITSVWPILINTAEGVRQIPDDYNNVAKVLQLSRQEYYINILFPSALPYLECLPAKLHQRNSVSGVLHWGCWFVARSHDGLVAAKDCSPSRKVVNSIGFTVDG